MKKIDMRKTLLAIALISAAIYIVFAGAEYYSHRAALAQWLPGRAATDAAHDIAAGSNAVVGCYSALIEERSEQASQANESAHPVRAKDLRLTAQRASRSWTGHTAFQVVPANASEQFNFRDAYWIIANGRLSIIFSNTGLSGIQLTLAPTEKGFEGTVEEFWDAGPSVTNKRKVILTRRLC